MIRYYKYKDDAPNREQASYKITDSKSETETAILVPQSLVAKLIFSEDVNFLKRVHDTFTSSVGDYVVVNIGTYDEDTNTYNSPAVLLGELDTEFKNIVKRK